LGFGNWSFDPVRVEENGAVTQDGVDVLTAYPRELHSLWPGIHAVGILSSSRLAKWK